MNATSLSKSFAVAATCFSLLLSSACAVDPSPDNGGRGYGDDKSDSISPNDNPDGLDASFTRTLADLISEGDVGQTFGTDDDMIPYPDTYWPMVDNGIDVRWAVDEEASVSGTLQESPLEKFMALHNPSKTEDAKAWEQEHHGFDVPNVASWFGHCPGWSAAAVSHAPIDRPVFAKLDNGHAVECEEGSDACVKFEIGDLNGLQAEVYNNARARFIGSRCDTDKADIEFDDDGRIVRKGKGCQGLNAGSMLIVAGNMMKLRQKPFIIDAQNEFNTEQIWNQPAYRYTLNEFSPLTEAEAAKLVSNGAKDEYEWNNDAKGFAKVDFTLHWITETSGPNVSVVDGAEQTNTTTMVAVIELDADASDSKANIIGGEYLDDDASDASRLRVAPFVWVPVGVGNDFDGRHNPFVKGQTVLELVAMGERKVEAPAEDCAHDVCTTGEKLVDSCNSCASAVCADDAFCCNNEWDNLCVQGAERLCDSTCN